MISGQFATVGVVAKKARAQLAAVKRLQEGGEGSCGRGQGRERLASLELLELKTPSL